MRRIFKCACISQIKPNILKGFWTVTVEFSQWTDVRVLCGTPCLEEHKNCERC